MLDCHQVHPEQANVGYGDNVGDEVPISLLQDDRHAEGGRRVEHEGRHELKNINTERDTDEWLLVAHNVAPANPRKWVLAST